MFTVPRETPVMTPSSLIVAMLLSALLHVTVLLVAVEGRTLASRVEVCPTSMAISESLNSIELTGVGMTVMELVAVTSGFDTDVAVITALPSADAVTRPVSSPVATVGSLLHRMFLSYAFAGITVADNCRDSVTLSSPDVRLSVIPLTGIPVTETSHDAVTPEPSIADTVMTVIPGVKAVIRPEDFGIAAAPLYIFCGGIDRKHLC